jgi:hypothetical protein
MVQSAYARWTGQVVVLQVATGDLRVPLRGVIVSESHDALRFRIGDGYDVDIFKNMILSVEEDTCTNIDAFALTWQQ